MREINCVATDHKQGVMRRTNVTPQEFVVKMLIGRSKRTKSHSFVNMRDGDSLKQLFVCNYYSNDAVSNLIKVKKKRFSLN